MELRDVERDAPLAVKEVEEEDARDRRLPMQFPEAALWSARARRLDSSANCPAFERDGRRHVRIVCDSLYGGIGNSGESGKRKLLIGQAATRTRDAQEQSAVP